MVTHWTKANPRMRPDGGTLFDPYYEWAETTKFRFLSGHTDWLPVLIELRKITARDFAVGAWDPLLESKKWLRVLPLFADPPPGLEKATFCVALARNPFFQQLRNGVQPLTSLVKRFELGVPAPTTAFLSVSNNGLSSNPNGGAGVPHASAPGESHAASQMSATMVSEKKRSREKSQPKPARVIVGVIDDGLAFAHERFRDESMGIVSSRIEHFWGQDFPPQGSGVAGSIGWTFARTDFEKMFKDSAHGASLDEDQVYRLAGLRFDDPEHKSIAHRASHGAHVMDLACGLNVADVKADSPRIVAVQLPDIVTEQTDGALLTPYALLGVWYILAKAHQLGSGWGVGLPPVVINLSYGTMSGPHDGTSPLEAALDQIIDLLWTFAKWRVSVVLPSGNSHLARCHARLEIAADAKVEIDTAPTLRWLVLPDDRTQSFLEVWMPCDAAAGQVELNVVTPTGDASGWIKEGDPDWIWSPAVDPLCSVEYRGIGAAGSRRLALICLFPTATISPVDEIAPSGVWKVALRNVGSAPLIVDAWIRRDDNAPGYPIRGRQSRFDDPRYERFGQFGLPEEVDSGPSYVLRAGAINGLATGKLPVVAGGCRYVDLDNAAYSAGGPTLRPQGCGTPARAGPDVLSVSDHSVACHGVLAAGVRSGSTVAMTGTSIAAPQIARWIAKRMQAGARGTRGEVAAEGINQEGARAANIPPLHPKPTASRGGEGRIELPRGELPRANTRRPPQFR